MQCKYRFEDKKKELFYNWNFLLFRRRPTFIPRAPIAGGPGAGLGAGSSGISGIIGGIACPLLCLGCLAALALLGLFGTMIGAAAYMSTWIVCFITSSLFFVLFLFRRDSTSNS